MASPLPGSVFHLFESLPTTSAASGYPSKYPALTAPTRYESPYPSPAKTGAKSPSARYSNWASMPLRAPRKRPLPNTNSVWSVKGTSHK